MPERPLRSTLFAVTVFRKLLQFGYEMFPRSLWVELLVVSWGTILEGSETWGGGVQLEQISHALEGYPRSLVRSLFILPPWRQQPSPHSPTAIMSKDVGPRHDGSTPLKPLNCSPSILVITTADILRILETFHYRGWRDGSVVKSSYYPCKNKPGSGSQHSHQAAHNCL